MVFKKQWISSLPKELLEIIRKCLFVLSHCDQMNQHFRWLTATRALGLGLPSMPWTHSVLLICGIKTHFWYPQSKCLKWKNEHIFVNKIKCIIWNRKYPVLTLSESDLKGPGRLSEIKSLADFSATRSCWMMWGENKDHSFIKSFTLICYERSHKLQHTIITCGYTHSRMDLGENLLRATSHFIRSLRELPKHHFLSELCATGI